MRTLYDCHVWRHKLERAGAKRVEIINDDSIECSNGPYVVCGNGLVCSELDLVKQLHELEQPELEDRTHG